MTGSSSSPDVRIPGYGIEVDPNTRTVWLHGEVDMASAPVLYAAAITLLTNPSADAVTIDLADVTWADSALPNTITAICDDINPTPTVRVINYDNRIKKLFLICDLGSYLDQIS